MDDPADALQIPGDLPPGLAPGRFVGWQSFQDRVREMLAVASGAGCPEIILCDPDFSSWPLGESAVVQSLAAWSKRGRRLTLLAQSFAPMPRLHPRFVTWRQRWDHILDCRRGAPVRQGVFPSVIWTPGWVLHHFEGDLFEGVISRDASRRLQLRETLAEVIKTSAPGFPSTTLGL
jgi:hypothetical protein